MLDKTKAAMRGRQCDTENKEHLQLTRPCAGGQSLNDTGIPVSHAASILTVPANTGALNFPQWGELLGIEISADPNVLHWRELAAAEISEIIDLHRWWKLPSNRVANLQLVACTRQGYAPSAQTYKNFVTPAISPDLGRLIFNRGRNSAYRDPDIGYHYLSTSLAFLRCSAFSLRPQASSTHAEKLAPEFSAFSFSTLASISSMSSWGNLMCFLADLLLVLPVAICAVLKLGVNTPYTKEMPIKTIDMGAHQNVWWVHTLFWLGCQNSEARQCANTNRASYHKPLSEVTVMADNQSTQTRPKFTWRFLALNRHDKKAKPCRLSVEAATEREARSILAPHFILSLAARLPAPEVLS